MVYMKNIYFYEIPAQFNSIELKDNSANGSVTFSIYIYISFFEKKQNIHFCGFFMLHFRGK